MVSIFLLLLNERKGTESVRVWREGEKVEGGFWIGLYSNGILFFIPVLLVLIPMLLDLVFIPNRLFSFYSSSV